MFNSINDLSIKYLYLGVIFMRGIELNWRKYYVLCTVTHLLFLSDTSINRDLSSYFLIYSETRTKKNPRHYRPPEWSLRQCFFFSFFFFQCICVISCLEQIGHLCLLMSLCWWVFSHHFPPSTLPSITLWESHHLCVKQLFLITDSLLETSSTLAAFQPNILIWLHIQTQFSCLPLINSIHSVSSWCAGLTIW